jgi:hypothetical protein
MMMSGATLTIMLWRSTPRHVIPIYPEPFAKEADTNSIDDFQCRFVDEADIFRRRISNLN